MAVFLFLVTIFSSFHLRYANISYFQVKLRYKKKANHKKVKAKLKIFSSLGHSECFNDSRKKLLCFFLAWTVGDYVSFELYMENKLKK